MHSGGGAFGAGKAGGEFDPKAYIKKPQVILRLVSLFFAIIVFGCITSQGSIEDRCQYGDDSGACSFGTATGVIAFLGILVFLVLDAVFETHISSVQQRKYIVMADMIFSGVWTFFWFVCACYLSDMWRKTDKTTITYGSSGMQAAIAFSWFSIGTFGGLTYSAVKRYRKGITEDFTTGFDQATAQDSVAPPGSSPYSESGDPYQQSPFGAQQGQGEYRPPTY